MSGPLLIIGSGAAGMLAALEAASRGAHPVLLTKDELGAGNTGYAQGGLSALTPLGVARGDSVQDHVSDTLAAGAGHCSPDSVTALCQDGPELITELERLGVRFDRDAHNDYQLGLEAAHSAHRILHINGDATGAGLVRALSSACRRQQRAGAMEIIDHAQVTELRLKQGRINAVAYLRAGQKHVMHAHTVLLATGGIGCLYQTSTNPVSATGDGIALAARAGAVIADMEFVQFHPTMVDTKLYPGAGMISEAVRGEGAWLVNDAGQRFMPGIDERVELAPRDVIARAIHAQNLAGQQVYLDARHLESVHGSGFLTQRFPSITKRLAACGLDLALDLVPVKPAQHYLMGGILTDRDGRSTVPGLYAAGECANALVHGANRLASNSLLDAMVFARRAVKAILHEGPHAQAQLSGYPVTELPAARPNGPLGLADLQQLAAETLAVHRDGQILSKTITRLQESSPVATETRAQVELENLLLLARMIAHAALERTHSLGAHHRTDHPEARTAPRTLWQLAASEQNQHPEEAKEIYA